MPILVSPAKINFVDDDALDASAADCASRLGLISRNRCEFSNRSRSRKRFLSRSSTSIEIDRDQERAAEGIFARQAHDSMNSKKKIRKNLRDSSDVLLLRSHSVVGRLPCPRALDLPLPSPAAAAAEQQRRQRLQRR